MTDINQNLADRIAQKYEDIFGVGQEVLLHSPGRINLIGEHTDYNQGLVLPSAVSLGIYFAIGESVSSTNPMHSLKPQYTHEWHALDLNKSVSLGRDQLGKPRGDWSDFLHGSWLALKERYPELPYFQAVFSGDLPMGAGMSSSSALTCGVLFGLNEAFTLGLSRLEIASLAHQVERKFIGLRGGIMDQYASVLSKPSEFLMLDCKDLSHSSIATSEDMHIFLINTNVQRELTESGYNSRSDECALAVKQIHEHIDIQSLRDVSMEELLSFESMIQPIPFKRARYVLEENNRVYEAVDAIQQSDWTRLGNILYAGHDGLRTEFEVSIPELDFLVEYTKNVDWIHGARMMGGGFGGCTINIAKQFPSEAFINQLTEDYYRRFGLKPTFISVSLSGGTKLLTV